MSQSLSVGNVYMTSISLRVNELKWIFIAQQRDDDDEDEEESEALLIFCLM